MAQRAERGIPKAEVESIIERIAAGSSMPRGKVRAELIPDSSWKRAGKVLGPQASQTAARLSRVFAFAEKVWGNEKDAADWMNRAHMELGGATPYSMLRTEAGGHAVENVLAALEYGFPV
jgi:putative toxin-antitoxin system antitoxin component (TIGR02293 family)